MKKNFVGYIVRDMKIEHQHPIGLLQASPILEWKWEVVTMEFIIGLSRKQDYIMVVVDKFFRATHCILIKSTHNINTLYSH
jgi:hypothetical protein